MLIKNKKSILYGVLLNFSGLNTINAYSLTMEEVMNAGQTAVNVISLGITKAMIIITILRILNEFLNNGNNLNRIAIILKECFGVVLIVYVIPKIPFIIYLFSR